MSIGYQSQSGVNLGQVVLRGEVVGVVVLWDQLPGSSCSYERVKENKQQS
jgi:hypothetical protein